MKKDIRTLAALLIASATFVACSSDNNIIDEIQQPATGKYTMTINASKGDDGTTRALALSGKTLNVKWAATDQVSVFPASWRTPLGKLTAAASDDGSTTLTGDLVAAPTAGDNLNLLFPSATWDYTGQTGVLLSDANSIEKKYDYALAEVTVAEVDGNTITTTGDANFTSQQAIVKFILKNEDGSADLSVTKLNISAASGKLVTGKGYIVKAVHSGYTATAGSGGFSDQDHSNLVDGNNGKKWCQSGGPWSITFNTADAVWVDGYTLTTGGDTYDYPGRNPMSWVLQGKLNEDDAWTTIATVTDDATMPAENNYSVDFIVDNPGSYQYFKFDISATQGEAIMQLSEMQLWETTNGTAYGDLTVTPASATSEMTVALRNENASTDTYTLTAKVGGINYTYEKSGVNFQNGKYYEITVKMAEQAAINLSTLTTDYEAQDGEVLTGTLDGEAQPYKISIAAGATVTLDGVNINGVDYTTCPWAGINCLGDATIILKDGTTNTMKGFFMYYPGIHVVPGSTLTIDGSGSLTASSNGFAAGIGGGWEISCGNIVIEGGIITASGGHSAAGIGSGFHGICGNITILNTVTKVTASSSFSNSIGAGHDTSCGTVTIGGVVYPDGIITSPYTYQP